MKQILSQDEGKIAFEVAAHPNTPASVLEHLAWYSASPTAIAFRRTVAANPGIPLFLLKRLLDDDNKFVLAAIAQNPAMPSEWLTLLSLNFNREVQKSLLNNPKTPGEALIHIFKFGGDTEQILHHPNTPAEVLIQLPPVHDPWLMAHPNAPISLLESAVNNLRSNDAKHMHRCLQVARNPSAPASLLEKLAHHSDAQVRRNVAENPNTPAPVLHRLASDRDKATRCCVARNPNTVQATLQQLAHDPSPDVRESITRNPHTQDSELEIQAQEHPSLPSWYWATLPENPYD